MFTIRLKTVKKGNWCTDIDDVNVISDVILGLKEVHAYNNTPQSLTNV